MKKIETDLLKITMTYHQLADPALRNFVLKIKNAEVSAQSACRLRKVVQTLLPALEKMQKEYIETIQKPHEELLKTEKDALKQNELNKLLDDKNEEFGKTEVTFETLPLAPQHLSELKVSAAELEALGLFFDETGEIRTAHFKNKLGIVPDSGAS